MEFLDIDGFRLIAAFACGTLLSLSGSFIQGITQNELAGPSTLGFNALSVLCILSGHALIVSWPHLWRGDLGPLAFLCFFFLIGIFHLIFLAFSRKKEKSARHKVMSNRFNASLNFFILLGLCFNLFAGAIFSFLQFAFMALNKEFPTQLWFGNFRFVDRSILMIVLPSSFLLYLWAIRLSQKIRPLCFGLDFAAGLGIPVRKIQGESILLALYAEGVVSSFFGIFSFVGFIFPLLLRRYAFFRRNIRREILVGSLLGGFFLSVLDILCQEISLDGAEIPVGLLTSIVGTFFLMVILLRQEWKKQRG